MEKKRTKTEAELITAVANIHDAEACLRYAQRAMEAGMPVLAAACEERAKTLKPFKALGVKKTPAPRSKAAKVPMKTHIVAEQALTMLIEDYKVGLHPTTYGELALRCGFEGQQNARWFGQVTDLIDAACALAGVPSFALARVREANGHVNHAAWRKWYSHLRDRIIATALPVYGPTRTSRRSTMRWRFSPRKAWATPRRGTTCIGRSRWRTGRELRSDRTLFASTSLLALLRRLLFLGFSSNAGYLPTRSSIATRISSGIEVQSKRKR